MFDESHMFHDSTETIGFMQAEEDYFGYDESCMIEDGMEFNDLI